MQPSKERDAGDSRELMISIMRRLVDEGWFGAAEVLENCKSVSTVGCSTTAYKNIDWGSKRSQC